MIVTYKYIPETKGKSLEEIEAFLKVSFLRVVLTVTINKLNDLTNYEKH
jgi:hypothetical protein